MIRCAPIVLVPLALFAPACAVAQPASNTGVAAEPEPARPVFSQRDVFELERAGDPRISPDGERVVYTRLGYDVLTDRATSDLWIINADGTGHQPLVVRESGSSQPRWSPDGDRVAFVSTFDGRSQIFVHHLDSGRTGPITRLTESPSSLTWSPDGMHLAFSMFVPGEGAKPAPIDAAPKDADWGPPIEIFDRLVYRIDGRGDLKPGNTHLFVVPAHGGTARQLTTGEHDHNGPFAWTPDGATIVLSANRRADRELEPNDSDLHAVDVRSGAITQLTTRFGPDTQPAISPDGRTIAYVGFDDRFQAYQPEKLYVCAIDGSNPRLVTGDLDREVAAPVWSADGREVYVRSTDLGRTKILRVDARTGAITEVAADLGGMSLGRPYGGGSFTVSDNATVAFTQASPERPAELAVVRGERIRTITDLNGDLVDHRDMRPVEEIWADSSIDDTRIQGWYVTPPGFDPSKRYPMILEIHGGPVADYGPRFAAEIQLYAAAGYVVLYTNPRGSTSYGEAFGNAIHHAYPGDDHHDLMDCVDALIAKGFIDEDRLFITGGSGGGVLTAWAVGKTDRFAGAVVQKPVINWYSMILYGDFPAFFMKYWFPGPPWEHQDHYMARSPISLVGNVTTPTMLITGSNDLRTPLAETEQYYTALKLREIPTKLVRVPDAAHGIAAKPSNLIAKVAEILAWFGAHDPGSAEE
ncbi:MAG: S9 family peptidase [Phycisphaerales bacterium]